MKYDKWSDEKIKKWIPTQYWFQSFPWGVQKADSQGVWDTFKDIVSWDGKTVLDIGGHTGFFSFKASRLGAKVTMFEPNAETMVRAKTIGRHIECVDVDYADEDPMGQFDIIMYLSVHHQPDPSYATLAEKLAELRSRCKHLFLELIVPFSKDSLTEEEIGEVIGVEPLLRYRHGVRGKRNIYHLESHA